MSETMLPSIRWTFVLIQEKFLHVYNIVQDSISCVYNSVWFYLENSNQNNENGNPSEQFFLCWPLVCAATAGEFWIIKQRNGTSHILFYKNALIHRLFLGSAKYIKECTDLVMSKGIYLKISKKSSRQAVLNASNFPEVLAHIIIKNNVWLHFKQIS